MPETGLSGIDASEESVVNVFLVLDEFLFLDDAGLYIFEVAGVQKFDKVVAVEKGNISVVPKYFQFSQLFIEVNIVSENS